jgi:hypothetical protein
VGWQISDKTYSDRQAAEQTVEQDLSNVRQDILDVVAGR